MKISRVVVVVLILLVVVLAGLGAEPAGEPRLNVLRVNLGGLISGPWTSTYGLDFSYERILENWLGWNFSTWFANDLTTWGVGAGTSLDFFFIGRAPTGVFLNARAGVISGAIYNQPVLAVRTGISLGYQVVLPRGFVFRVGSGTAYIINYGFVPRAIMSIGYAF
jgi:hypothetical protein